ncbi:protein SULFUR DEFICIENCY-INDUCED 1-like [Andrographis paniculata]|uniref:protein SULFUR DEFICIENCY-INDUCED 1-like n=1 Tax=Andrographis paniculata TaxID=175694 RepID=UPI0021E6EF09|nr:protein SULFUR DEFICIENCY-INDUCED 1-like [Andrographis paniculata]
MSEEAHNNNNNNTQTKMVKKKNQSKLCEEEAEAEAAYYRVVHKLPRGGGDTPYARAKHFQLVEKKLEWAAVYFWKAIDAGDRVDSALKDMAVVMKQLDRSEEAIHAVRALRGRCSNQAQESLDNLLIDLYKKCGRVEEQIELLKQKLRMIGQGEAFNGKPTKTARSHGKKFQVTVKQEASRILGNLGWAYMQQANYRAAQGVYEKAQEMEPDANKACNLCVCLLRQGRYCEARRAAGDVLKGSLPGSDEPKSRARAEELLKEMEMEMDELSSMGLEEDGFNGSLDQQQQQQQLMSSNWKGSRRLPIFEEISSWRWSDQLACT